MHRAQRPRFTGFHPDAFRFFRRLARNNTKPWFDRNRAAYDEHIAGALKALCEDLAPFLLSLDPDFEVSGKTGKNLSRINRDIRFAHDKSPYHRNLYLYFAPRGSAGDTCLYIGLSADGLSCGLSVYGGGDSFLERQFKPRRARDPQAVERFLCRLARRYDVYWHATEKGHWKKYLAPPRTDKEWKRCRALIVRRIFPASKSELRSPRFLRTIERNFRALYPLYAFATLDGPPGDRALHSAQ